MGSFGEGGGGGGGGAGGRESFSNGCNRQAVAMKTVVFVKKIYRELGYP